MIDDTDKCCPLDETLTKDYDDTDDYMWGGDGCEVRFVNLSEGEREHLVSTFESNRRRFRRIRQEALRREERRAAKVQRLRALFLQDKTWAAVGGDILIKDMTPNHALNSYSLITNEWPRYAGASISFAELETGYADANSTPLAQALHKRSKKRPSWRDRRKDNEARERFKDRQAKALALASNMWGGDW